MADLGQLRVRINIDDAGANQTLAELKRNTATAQAQFKAFSAGIDKSSQSMKTMKDQVAQLEQIIALQNATVMDSKKAWDEAIKKHGESSAAAQKLEQQYYKNITAMEQTKTQLGSITQKMKDMPNAFDKIGGVMSKAGDGFKSFGGKLEQLGSKFAPMTKALAGLSAAAVGLGVAFVGSALKDVTDFQVGMNKVFTLLPNITKPQMDSMSEQVKKFSLDMGILPNEVLPALYDALSAGGGITKDNVFEYLTIAQKTAIGGVTDLGTALNGITSVVNSYGSSVLSAGRASDIMFTASALGKTDIKELSESLFNVIPTASALGVKFEDIGAAMGAMTAQGVPTSVASTQLRQLLVELSKSGSKAAEAFQKISGKSFKDFIAGGGDVNKALEIMNKAAKNNHLQLQDMFGSVEAGNAALALFDNKGFIDGLDQMKKSAGATDAAYNTMNTGIQKSLDRIKSQFAVFKLNVAKTFAPIIEQYLVKLNDKIKSMDWNKIIEGGKKFVKQALVPLGDGLRKVIDFFKGLDGNTIKWIGTIALASTVIAPVTKVIGGLSGAIGSVVSIGGSLVTKIAGSGGIMAALASIASPVGLAVAAAVAIGGIALAFQAWHKEADQMKEVNLDQHEALVKQYEDTDAMITQFDQLRTKSKLTATEFGKYVDLQKRAASETDPKLIEAYQKQMDELQKKSGMSNTELQTMIDRNNDIVKALPDATGKVTDQGNKIADTTDKLRLYNQEIQKMSTLELEKQFFNSLGNQKQLIKDLADEQRKLNAAKQQDLDLQNLLSAGDEDSFSVRIQGYKDEYQALVEKRAKLLEIRQDVTDDEKERAAFLETVKDLHIEDRDKVTDLLIEQKKSTTEIKTQIENTKTQQTQFDSVTKQLMTVYLTNQGISKEKAQQAVDSGNELVILDQQITSLEAQKQKLFHTKSINEQNTDQFKQQVANIDKQIEGLNTSKGQITDLIGSASTYNTELGKDVDKAVVTRVQTDDTFKNLGSWVEKVIGIKTDPDKTYKDLGDTVTKTIKIIASGIQALTGYAVGTDFHPGGLAMAGEKGYELAQMGNKFAMLTAGVYNLPRGTKVYTHEQTKAMLATRDMASMIMPTRNNVNIPTHTPSTTNNTTNWQPSIVVHGSNDPAANARAIRRVLRRASFEGGLR